MKELVEELKKKVTFKETINIKDVVLIVGQEPQMLFFAMITAIERDNSRKDEWWHVSMQSLSIPLQPMTWTLRMPQICGQEVFTMGGEERFMAPVRIDFKENSQAEGAGKAAKGKQKGGGNVKLRVVK
jgi:hypothetical protein